MNWRWSATSSSRRPRELRYRVTVAW